MACCNVTTKVSYFVAGIGIGAAIALLFAPQSGEETRKQIAEKAQDGKDFVAAKGREIRKQAVSNRCARPLRVNVGEDSYERR